MIFTEITKARCKSVNQVRKYVRETLSSDNFELIGFEIFYWRRRKQHYRNGAYIKITGKKDLIEWFKCKLILGTQLT